MEYESRKVEFLLFDLIDKNCLRFRNPKIWKRFHSELELKFDNQAYLEQIQKAKLAMAM